MALDITFSRHPVNERAVPLQLGVSPTESHIVADGRCTLLERPLGAVGDDPHIPDTSRFDIYYMSGGAPVRGELVETSSETPDAYHYYVDYVTGDVSFHSSRNGTEFFFEYYGVGSVIRAEDVVEVQTAVQAINAEAVYRDGSVPLTGDLDLNGHNIIVRTQSAAGLVDGVNLAYHDHTGGQNGVKLKTDSFSTGSITYAKLHQSVQQMLVQSGTICMWYGPVETIPVGWQECNGSGTVNGMPVPDLRDKFVVGAGLSYAARAQGGTTAHKHAIPTHSHTLSAHTHSYAHTHNITLPAHTHTWTHQHSVSGNTSYANAAVTVMSGTDVAGARYEHYHTWTANATSFMAQSTSSSPASTTTAAASPELTDGPSVDSTGSISLLSDDTTTLPPYYALIYIIKL